MNLSNEKNTLLNTVSRFAVGEGARLLGRYVTRGAMAAAALTIGTVVVMDSTPAIASCAETPSNTDGNANDALAAADGLSVTCTDTVAGGYDADGYDNLDIRVFEDGSAVAGVGIDLGSGSEKGDPESDGNNVFVFDLFFGGAAVGTVTGTAGDGIVVTGDDNTINNGFTKASDIVGGGKISGTDDGIDIDGEGNTVNNFDNANGANSGVISGGGGASDDGIEVSGGTSGNENVINNGLLGKDTSYIISGGTPGGNVTGDDGVDADGWTKVNNGEFGEIHGEDRGIEFTGSAGATLTVDNDGDIVGDLEDGLVIQSSDTIVNYSGKGTLAGGRDGATKDGAGLDIGSGVDNAKVTVTFDEGGLIEGYTHGAEIGPNGENNKLIIQGKGTVEGDGTGGSDGVHVFETSTGNEITIDDGALVQGRDDGVDMASGNKLLVDGGSTVKGDTDGTGGGDGIQGDDDNEVHVTGASKVFGDPGILMDDGNKITVDGGSDVNADPEDGINVDDDNTILIGGAGGAGTVNVKGTGDGIDLGSDFDGGGGSTDGNDVTIGKDGLINVLGTGNGIVVGNEGADNEDNTVTIEDGGNVKTATGSGIIVNGQDEEADNNLVTIEDGGEVNAGHNGVELRGEEYVSTGLGAFNGGGDSLLFSDGDGNDNDLVNAGIIRAGNTGVLVSNTNSDVDNTGGEIYAGEDGVRFTTIHTDLVDGDTAAPGETESGYQSDEDSVIVAGRDGIHYDNYADDAGTEQSFHVDDTGEDVNGLGKIDENYLFFKIKGNFPEVVENEGVIEAQRHGIRVNDNFAVTNFSTGVIVAGGLDGKGSSGGDGIHADANNEIVNYGTIAAGEDADGDTHGIEVTGESNTILNDGIIDTRGDTVVDEINNATYELGAPDAQDNGAGGDGIHAGADGLTFAGALAGYDQQVITNNKIIIAADDGIEAQSGMTDEILDTMQLITNTKDGSITADDDGIVAKNSNIVTNDGAITADDDEEGGGDGINVGHSNEVYNTGSITSKGGNGIVVDGDNGKAGSDGNYVENTGTIVAGEDGVRVNGDDNVIYNEGDIKGGHNGVELNGEENEFTSTDGDIVGGSGAGIYSDEDNDIELSGTTKVSSTAGLGGDGIVLEDDNSLEIDDGVTVHGDNDGIVLEGDDNDVDYEGDGVNGTAELKGTTGDALRIEGDSNTFDSSDELDLQGGDDGIDISGNANSVDIDGNVGGEDDGIYLDTATGNVITVGGNVTGDTDDFGGGDGIDIFGGSNNNVSVTGDITGDPGVVITNSSNNVVSGATITGTDGGVIISNGNNNTVSTTVGDIDGNSDDDSDGDGVGITGNSNVVSSAGRIEGADAVNIDGNSNEVSAVEDIDAVWDGVQISGIGNTVTAGGFISGDDGSAVQIEGSSNTVTAGGILDGGDDGVEIDGNNNEVSGASIAGANSGVDIDGDGNDVDTDGSIAGNGDEGVAIDGNSNNVNSNGISGFWDGVDINGNSNIIDSGTGGITGDGGQGVDVTGNNNQITSGDTINGGSDGVSLDGDNNSVEAAGSIQGDDSGVVIDGDGNDVDTDGFINGFGDEGVAIEGNNNTVDATGVSGFWDGVDVDGNSNSLVIGGGGVSGTNGDGVDISGTGNSLTSGSSVTGGDDGVNVNGTGNIVSVSGTITGNNGDGVDITGSTNTVTATGAIIGDPGVIITGSSNTVSATSITGTLADGVNITGSSNSVTSTGAISGATDGIEIVSGSNNSISAGSVSGGTNGAVLGFDNDLLITGNGTSITGSNGVGVKVSGNSSVTSSLNNTNILGSTTGADVDGDNNLIAPGGTITGTNAIGVDVDGNNNNVSALGVSGGTSGLTIDGSNNTATVGGAGTSGNTGDGIAITGSNNNVTSGDVSGGDDGVEIDGNSNIVTVTNNITGDTNGNNDGVGDGVDINGNGNTVTATGNIVGDPGVLVSGNQNTVSAGADIRGLLGGAIVSGNQNTVTAGDDIETVSGSGVGINGNQNIVTAGDDIFSLFDDGINITGNQNQVTANDVIANDHGIRINGNQNFVDIAATITATTGNGVWFDSGTGNNVDLTNVTVTAGLDGILLDVDGNEFQHNAATHIIAGDDGIEFEYGGLVNAYESLVWLGTIDAADDGIVADSGFFTIINNGTINADTDKNSDGNGISVTSDNTVENNGAITGWNGIVGDDRNDIQNDGTINVTNDGIVVDDDNEVINNGTITAGDDGIVAGDKNYIENNSPTTIIAKDNGIEAGSFNEIINTGKITADSDLNLDGDGINAVDSNEITNTSTGDIVGWFGIVVNDLNKVTNNGDIEASNSGIFGDDDNEIVNTDDIDAQNVGIWVDDGNKVTNSGDMDTGNAGILAGDTNVITNTGTIDATTNGGIGIWAVSSNTITNSNWVLGAMDGIKVTSSNTITNSGSVKGNSDDGVELAGSSNSLTNSSTGTITGGQTGVEINGSSNTITNNNYIDGNSGDGVEVLSGSGNKVYNNDWIEGTDDGVDFDTGANYLYNYGGYIWGQGDEGVEISGNGSYVYNSGTIEGDGDDGVDIEGNSNQIDNYGTIVGEDDGIEIDGDNNTVYNYSVNSIIGENDDGIEIRGTNNYVYNVGSITGEDEGIEDEGYSTEVNNASDSATIIGQNGDGIDSVGYDLSVTNYGLIQGLWGGIDHSNDSLFVNNVGGTILGQNAHGIETEEDANINNTSEFSGGEESDEGQIFGEWDGINAGEGLSVSNNTSAVIQGAFGDGIEFEGYASIDNWGLIQGATSADEEDPLAAGIRQTNGFDETFIYNGSTGVITGTEAGYIYDSGNYYSGATVQIDNYGLIEVTGPGVLPDEEDEGEDAAVNLDLINGPGANPVAAIDTSNGNPNLETFIFNYGEIRGLNEFSPEIPAVEDDPDTEEDETKAAVPAMQLTNRFAILGGEGNEYIANFRGGVINGDIATQGGFDVLAMEIGSTLNGDADLGQTLETAPVLGLIPDDPDTKDVDESAGGTAVGFVETKDVDVDVDTVILFGEGYQEYDGDITEAEVLYVNDQLTEDDIREGTEEFEVTAVQPIHENQPFPVGTWTLNGVNTFDGTNEWSSVDIDGDGDGILDEETDSGDETVWYISGTIGTVVDNGRLNIGGTSLVEIPGEDSDEEEGDGTTYEYQVKSEAVLNSPVVDVLSGGILGGHGTIVTNPGANGGNGGVNLTGAVQGDTATTVGVNLDNLDTVFTPSEARGSLIVGTAPGDLVTQGEDGKVTDATKGDGINDFKIVVDEEEAESKVDLLYTVDEAGNLYPTITLPVGFEEEIGPSAFDFTTDSPRYATLAPGDEITRIGTLTVFGNVTMDGRETEFTNYVVARQDDPDTKDVNEALDEEGDQIYDNVKAREVVTNWGSQFQADLKDDGKGDLLLVKKTGVTSAFTGSPFDTKGPGPVDLVTQDAEGVVTDDEAGDGVNDFDIVVDGEDTTKVDRIVDGAGGPDGVPDGVAYKVSTVLDGHATVDGRLDIRLDGEFVDLVDNSQPATIPDPEGPTGCGDDPDGADSCPQVPNPLYNIPDGIADVDDKGIATPHADFSKDTKVWDIIVAEGGVSGKFDEKGFDGGPNDGAVVVRYDDPETPEDEELRVQLLKAYLQYLPDRVRIISIPNFGPKGETINQVITGEYIDSLTKYGLNEDLLHCIIASVGLDGDIPAALDALHPEWYNAFNEVGFSIARGAEHQAYIRTIEAQGFSGGQQNRVVMNVGDDAAVGSSASDRRATFWLAGSWGNADVDDGSNEGWLEYEYDTLTGYAGFDYLINPNLLLGILGGFSNSDVDSKNGTKEGDVDSWQVGGYASYFTESWFLNVGGGIGDMNIESIRNIDFGSGTGMVVSQVATADYDGDITYFYGKGGYSFNVGNSGWKLSPELALSYVKVKQDGFSEGGVGNFGPILLDVERQSVESLRGTAQLRLSKTFMAGNGGGWMPYVRVGIANEFEDELRPITSGFQGAPGTSFTVFGKVPRETTVIFGAGVSGKVSEMFSLYLDYSGEIGGSFSEHVISGGVRLHF
ncbi:MAG: hypothetical protein AB7O49_17200 [Sphingomonadales bacterium]